MKGHYLKAQESYLDTVSTARGSGWVKLSEIQNQ